MEEIKTFWSETMQMTEARWIVAITGLVACVAIAFYVGKLFRDMAIGKALEPADYISEFQKLRDEGKLDDEEYSRLAKSIPKDKPTGTPGGTEKLPGGLDNNTSGTTNATGEIPDFKPDNSVPVESGPDEPGKDRD